MMEYSTVSFTDSVDVVSNTGIVAYVTGGDGDLQIGKNLTIRFGDKSAVEAMIARLQELSAQMDAPPVDDDEWEDVHPYEHM